MTIITTYSPAPWSYGYSPYTLQGNGAADTQLPAFEIFDAGGNKIFDTNEHMHSEIQEANACLATAAPAMLEALRLALEALNTAPRFRVGDTDSYEIAVVVDAAIKATHNPAGCCAIDTDASLIHGHSFPSTGAFLSPST